MEKVKKSFNPKVSIIIPIYNGADYMREAIDSALAQTYKNIEVLVVNDGSTDNTEKIALSYGKKIKYFYKENGGVATALNLGIDKMEGEYFSWLSHDDIYLPEKVAIQIKELEGIPDKSTIIYGDYVLIDKIGKLVREENITMRLKPKELNNNLVALLHCLIGGCTLLIHKSKFYKFGVFNPNLITTQDYDLWFRIFKNSKVKYVHGFFVKTRIHTKQGSNIMSEHHLKESEELWLNIFKSLTDSEMIMMNGSKYDFYKTMFSFFKENGFLVEKTIDYLHSQILNEIKIMYKNLQNKDIALNLLCENFENINEKEKKDLEYVLSVPEKNKPRIVFWSDNWSYRGGLNRVLVNVTSLLAPFYEVYLGVGKNKDTKNGYKVDKNVKMFEFDVSGDSLKKIPELFLIMQVDIFVCSNNWLKKYLPLYKQCKDLGIKTIAWDHAHYFLPHNFPWLADVLFVKNDAYENADVVVWINSFATNIYRQFNERTIMMPNPVGFDKQKNVITQFKHPKDILGIALFDDTRKHLDRLIMVFAEILKKYPEKKLYVIGSYDLKMQNQNTDNETISELISRLKIKDGSIIFTGHVNDVESYYKKSAVHVMTSELEGFGLVITEAAYFGLPSVVFAGNGADDIITDGVDGYIVPRNDIKAMAEKVILLLEDEVLLRHIQEQVVKIPERYSYEIVEENWKKLIEAVLSVERDELGKYLDKEFPLQIKNYKKMLKDVVVMYEESIHKILSSQEERINMLPQTINHSEKFNLIFFLKKTFRVIFSVPIIGRIIEIIYLKLKKYV